jgi:hypothetical protein
MMMSMPGIGTERLKDGRKSGEAGGRAGQCFERSGKIRKYGT